ncbi:hypothetical protein [Endozoicomonas sp. YOMI1]|uniref:hypothetical protein n=1 Tax=Endozoicomonas sp. YOMI1 TaxID=2828739 RepID=UPI00214933ED|nr:hypothetical protein [Endozoicomonas sp. YOMI1]
MAIDWESFESDLDERIDSAGERTDARLAEKMSSITRMTDEEIQELLPDPADAKKLTDLMKIVKSADDRNTKVNMIVANAEDFGGVLVTLLEKFT